MKKFDILFQSIISAEDPISTAFNHKTHQLSLLQQYNLNSQRCKAIIARIDFLDWIIGNYIEMSIPEHDEPSDFYYPERDLF